MVTKLFHISLGMMILMVVGCSASPPYQSTRRAPLSLKQEQLQQADENFTKQIQAGTPGGLASAYLDRGKTRLTLGEYDHAITDLKEALRLAPGSAAAYVALSACYAKKQQPYEERVARGWSEYYDSRISVAISTFTVAAQLDPRRVDAWWGRSKSYVAQGTTDAALKDLNMVIKLDPRQIEAFFERGKVNRSQGKEDLALDDINHVLRENPDHLEALFQRGDIHGSQGQLDEALGDLNRVLRANPTHFNALVRRAQVHVLKGSLDLALSDAHELLRMNPSSPHPYIVQGIVTFRRNQYAEAVMNFDHGVRMSADYSELALKTYDQLIRDRPEIGSAYHARAVVYYQIGRFQEAIADLDLALTKAVDVPQAEYDRGMAYLRQWKYSEAINDFEQALRQRDQFATTVLSGGQRAQISLGEDSLRGSANNIGGLRDPNIHKNLAWSYYQTGRYERAGEIIGQVAQTNKSDHEAWFFLGMVYAKLGNFKAAIEVVSNASRLAPANSTYQTMVQELAKQQRARDIEGLSAAILGGLAIMAASDAIDTAKCDKSPECRERRTKQMLDDMENDRRKAIDDWAFSEMLRRR